MKAKGERKGRDSRSKSTILSKNKDNNTISTSKSKFSIKSFFSQNKGFRQFLIKTIFFIGLFLGIQIATIPFQKINLPKEYAISWLLHPELGNVIVFSAIAFFLISMQKIMKIREQKTDLKERLLLGFLLIIGLVFYFFSKFYLSTHSDFAIRYIYLFLPIQYLLLVLFTLLLFFTVFGLSSTKSLIREFKKEIGIVSVTAIITYFSIELLKNSWQYLSAAVTYSVYFLLKFSNLNPMMNFEMANSGGPILGAGKFIVSIGKPCSGIDSLTLFTLLYLFIFFIDYKVINKKRMLLLFIPGAMGMFAVNIIRIYSLMLIGIFYSVDFAVGMFHSNAGWIFFIIYSFIFWGLGYKWVKKK